ncbi:hypothetical protein TM233_36900 [Bradyrhizobium sp. TM233]|nr:hypothetical protein TM233_36900 [Bradyrhizobium sp. TM233]
MIGHGGQEKVEHVNSFSCPGRGAALPAMRSIVRCGALQSRDPCGRSVTYRDLGPGSAQQRKGALQRVRDTRGPK